MLKVASNAKRVYAILFIFCCLFVNCSKKSDTVQPPGPVVYPFVNTAHLDYLYTPVVFSTGKTAAGIYIYSESPDYKLVGDKDEGFTCVDDVSRAALVYVRSDSFDLSEKVQSKVYNLISFLLEMQAPNGYFYNFILPGDLINKYHANSVPGKNWWSWRAFQTLTEAAPLIRSKNPSLAALVDAALSKIITNIKTDMATLPLTTAVVNGIVVPQWLPLGSAADQASTLLIGLINYCTVNSDAVLQTYIAKLADGMVMMQQGDGATFPYGCFLSWENEWHAYGNDQAYALLLAGIFLNNNTYTGKALIEVGNFYPWLLSNGMRANITFMNAGVVVKENQYAQIAYAIRPIVFACAEAYKETGNAAYADDAGHFAAWFLGRNDAGITMYSNETGRCFDGLSSASAANTNAGAESTIEALLTLQMVAKYPAIKAALDKYKK